MTPSPIYSIQQDGRWQSNPKPKPKVKTIQASLAPSVSVYSDDSNTAMESEDMPPVVPLKVLGRHLAHSRGYSRLPIFQHVRSMLHRPPALHTFTTQARSNESAETPNNHNDSRERIEVRRRYSGECSSQDSIDHRSPSPVSASESDNIYPSSPPQLDFHFRAHSPVSPVSPVSSYADKENVMPSPVATPYTAGDMSRPETPVRHHVITRKPAPQRCSVSTVNTMSTAPRNFDAIEMIGDPHREPRSHFSWTTYAPSIGLTRQPSTAETATDIDLPPRDWPQSHFSWSTVATQPPRPARHKQQSHFSWSTVGTQHIPPDSPPRSPTAILPTSYRTPPVQSILSRQRPVQRQDRDQHITPSRKSPVPDGTPRTLNSKVSQFSLAPRVTIMPESAITPGSGKKLPLPPSLFDPISPLSHLEALTRAESDKAHQRRNLERAICELSKTENASPMDVPFARVRDAKKRGDELRATLAEIRLEEREIGIAIIRARRKEGEEEGLWVRRVTG